IPRAESLSSNLFLSTTGGSMRMTGEQWMACGDPLTILAFLRGKASERKLRLFGAAFCRRVWGQLTSVKSRRAVEFAEGYADGAGARKAMMTAGNAANAPARTATDRSPEGRTGAAVRALRAARYTALADAWRAGAIAARFAALSAGPTEYHHQCEFLR